MERTKHQAGRQRVERKRSEIALASDSLRVPPALRLFNRTIFFALLCLIGLTAIPYGTVETFWEALFECLIFTLVGLWVIEGLWRGSWGIAGRSLLYPMLALVVYALIQTLPVRETLWRFWGGISADPYGTRLAAIKLLAITLAAALLFRFTSSRKRLRALIYLVLLMAMASAIFGMIRETTHHNSNGFLLPQLRPQVGYGQFINRNHFAYLMEMAFGLAVGLALGRGGQRDRLIYIAAILPVWLALVLANSRGGIFSMFSELLFLVLIYGLLMRGRKATQNRSDIFSRFRNALTFLPVRLALLAVLLLVMVAGVLMIGGEPLAKRLETLQGETAAGEELDTGDGARRMQIWQASWRMFKDHPVTGIGLGGYWVAVTGYYDVPGPKRPYEAHNDYLELLVSVGVIGSMLGIWFLIAFMRRVRAVLQSRDAYRRAACVGALTGLFGVAVHSLVDFGLQITTNALVCVVLIVIATVEIKAEEKQSADQVLISNKESTYANQ